MAYVTRKKKRARKVRVFKLLLWGLFLAGLFYGGGALLGSWSALEVKEVVVTGLTRHPVPSRISALKGRNLLKVDAASLREELLDNTDVKEVQVRKAYPDKIIITVFERRPLGLIKAGGERMCVDDEGVLFPETGSEEVPVITGEASLKAGLRLLAEIRGKTEFSVKALSCRAPYEVVATVVDEQGHSMVCNFGKEAFREKAEALAELIKVNNKMHYVDLRFIPYVVVRNGGGD